MPYLRFACLLAGLMVLLAPPALLYPTGVASNELAPAAGMLTLLLLAAASFFFIALAGHRIHRSPRLRRLSVPLLGAPFLAGVAGLWGSTTPTALWLSALLLGFTLTVAAILASPLVQGPSPRRLRARETRQRHHRHHSLQVGSELNYLPLSHHQPLSHN